jgi:predicted MFS family arabinose efflux permease
MNQAVLKSGTPAAASAARGWPAVVSVAVASLTMVTSEFLPIALLPDIGADLGVSYGTAGLMVVVPGLVAAVTAPVVTVVAGSVDRRLVLLALTGLLVVSNLVAATAPVFAVMVLARVLLGLAIGGFWTIGGGIAGRLVAERSAARGMALIMAGISAGTVLSLPLGSFIGSVSDWRVAFFAAAGLSLAVLAAQVVLLPKIPARQAIRLGTLLSVLRIPRARSSYLLAVLVIFGHFTAYTYLLPYLKDIAHLGDDLVSVVLLAYGVAGIVGNFAAGATAGTRLRTTMTVAAGLVSVSLVLLPFVAGSTPVAIALVVLWGLAWGGLPLMLQLRVVGSVPERETEAGLGILVSVIQIALAAGSLAGGALADGPGVSTAFVVAAVLMLAVTAVPWKRES